MSYIINDLESLEKLRIGKNLRNSFRKIQLEINIPNVEGYSRRINKYYFACGCQEGAIGVFISILTVSVIYITTDVSILSKWWYIVIYLAAGSLLGKIYGITYMKIMLNKTLKELKQDLLSGVRD